MVGALLMKEHLLPASEARRLFSYDETEGVVRWRISPTPIVKVGDRAGGLTQQGYLSINLKGRRYLAHRVAWLLHFGFWPTDILDHKNLNRTDNRIGNLRLADRSTNAANSTAHRDNKVGVKGVSFHKRSGKYRAVIRAHGQTRHIGLFETVDDAHAAYCIAAQNAFGEFWRAG